MYGDCAHCRGPIATTVYQLTRADLILMFGDAELAGLFYFCSQSCWAAWPVAHGQMTRDERAELQAGKKAQRAGVG